MSFVLPKEAKTRRLNSLPDDLRKVAEELIGQKFKVEEVVERTSRPTFRQEYPGDRGYAGVDELSNQRTTRGNDEGYYDDAWDGISVQRSYNSNSYIIAIEEVSDRTLLGVMHLLDMNNFRRRKSVIHLAYQDMRPLQSIPAFHSYASAHNNSDTIGTIYEFEVMVERGTRSSYIQVYC